MLTKGLRGLLLALHSAFFDLCREDHFAKTLMYSQVPEFYTWDSRAKKWRRRKRGQQHTDDIVKAPALGRIYNVSLRVGECYFLRLLLTDVVGPTSFANLRTVDGVCSSYREACQARGLLENDQHLQQCLEEASVSHSASSLRNLLAIILTACEPSNPLELWRKFRDALAEDFLHAHRQSVNNPEAAINNHIYNKTLCALENVVIKIGGHPLADYSLPSPDHTAEQTMAREYQQEISYDPEEMAALAEQLESSLTQDQQQVFKAFHTMVQQGRDTSGNNIMFLDAPGGTGKIYLINLLLAKSSHVAKLSWLLLQVALPPLSFRVAERSTALSRFHWMWPTKSKGRVPLRQTALLQQSSVRPKPLSSTRLQ
jgi:hypothetical protein